MAAVNERIEAAWEFLAGSDAEFAKPDTRQGSEKLWEAATRVVINMSQERGWEYGSHRAMKNAADRLAIEFDDPLIHRGFLAAEKFHRNFYHNFMEDFELESDRPVIHEFVERMLAYHERS